METVLKVSKEIHGRLKAACDARNIPLKSGTCALLTQSLDSLDNDEISLSPVMASAAPNNEEAKNEGGGE